MVELYTNYQSYHKNINSLNLISLYSKLSRTQRFPISNCIDKNLINKGFLFPIILEDSFQLEPCNESRKVVVPRQSRRTDMPSTRCRDSGLPAVFPEDSPCGSGSRAGARSLVRRVGRFPGPVAAAIGAGSRVLVAAPKARPTGCGHGFAGTLRRYRARDQIGCLRFRRQPRVRPRPCRPRHCRETARSGEGFPRARDACLPGPGLFAVEPAVRVRPRRAATRKTVAAVNPASRGQWALWNLPYEAAAPSVRCGQKVFSGSWAHSSAHFRFASP